MRKEIENILKGAIVGGIVGISLSALLGSKKIKNIRVNKILKDLDQILEEEIRRDGADSVLCDIVHLMSTGSNVWNKWKKRR